MHKLLLTFALILLVATTAMGVGSIQFTKDNATPVQGYAPDATKTVTLTGNSQTIDVSKDLAWSVYCPSADCKVRIMPTSAKGSYPQMTIPSGAWHTFVVNKNSGFANFSTAGILTRQ